MTLRKVKGNFDRIFDKTLTDLVRGIRNHKENEAKFISQCIEEIKEELRHDSVHVKANAIAKLTYLQMLGYDISWSAFNIIEVMSSTKFSHKRIGYLAASQCFHENTEVMMLTTNMIRKDLNSQNMYDAGCAMNGLACFVTTDISRDLANDVMTLLSSTKPYLRKKAVLLMYKIFLKFPDALKPAFPRLKEKLEDPDPGVQSAAVNVICELARKNPKNYLSLAPVFFKLMTNSTNNWMLIKIIKLFGALIPLEPRLGKKIIDPLTNLIHSTSAMSLLYECINTVIAVIISISSGLPNHSASIQLCVQKLRILIEDSDQNLKYLGLLAMNKILKTHPKSVHTHKDLVLGCLDDKDESIRLRALDLLYGMVTKKNLMEIVHRLVNSVTDGQLGSKFRDELILKLVEICAQNDYQYIVNFEWYLSVLIELSRVEGGTIHGQLIAQQILDVAIRVDAIRQFATEQMSILLQNSSLFLNNSSVCEVLYAAAWICGEFANFLPDQESTIYNLLSIHTFPPHITAVFIQNASKIFSKCATIKRQQQCRQENGDVDDNDNFISWCNEIEDMLLPYLQSSSLEIQERATSLLQIIHLYKEEHLLNCGKLSTIGGEKQNSSLLLLGNNNNNEDDDTKVENDNYDNDDAKVLEQNGVTVEQQQPQQQQLEELNFESFFYAYPLNPVAAKAQRKVPIPVGLDLSIPFFDNTTDDDSDDSDNDDSNGSGSGVDSNENVSINFGKKKIKRRNNATTKNRRQQQGILLVDGGNDDHDHDEQRANTSSEVDEKEERRRAAVKESRRFEQENNPHYLKSKVVTSSATATSTAKTNESIKSSKKKRSSSDQSQQQPQSSSSLLMSGGGGGELAEEATDVLKSIDMDYGDGKQRKSNKTTIPGLVSSDRFLQQNIHSSSSGSSSKKSKSKKLTNKRNRKSKQTNDGVDVDDEDDDDDNSTPQITIRQLEMPEGAKLNDDEEEEDDDNDRGVVRDAHRALAKISLDDDHHHRHVQSKKAMVVENNNKLLKKTKKSTKSSSTVPQDDNDDETVTTKKKKKKTTATTTTSKKSSSNQDTSLLSSSLADGDVSEKKKKKKSSKISTDSKKSKIGGTATTTISTEVASTGNTSSGSTVRKSKVKKQKDSKNRAEYQDTFESGSSGGGVGGNGGGSNNIQQQSAILL